MAPNFPEKVWFSWLNVNKASLYSLFTVCVWQGRYYIMMFQMFIYSILTERKLIESVYVDVLYKFKIIQFVTGNNFILF